MSLLHKARRAVQDRFGIDIARYPESDPLFRLAHLLRTTDTTLVLDVGANDGGYATSIRRLGYMGRIVSFEPVRAAFDRLRSYAGKDARWDPMRLAVGATDGTATINVAGNAEASSSLLPMLSRHVSAAPSSAYVGTEEVRISRLDTVWDELGGDEDEVFLKIDVQGAEKQVLDGAERVLHQVCGVQCELNLVELYEGQAGFREMTDRLESAGFLLCGLVPGFSDRATGQMLQADGIFVRAASLALRG